jgi:epoxyqueuosine reductase
MLLFICFITTKDILKNKGGILNYKKEIIDFCNGMGLDTIGVSRCEYLPELLPFFIKRKNNGAEINFEEKIIEKRINPYLLLKKGKSIISIAFPYNYGHQEARRISFSSYTLGRNYHFVVSNYLKHISAFINELGGQTFCFVDDTPMPERYFAYKSGIGFIGKNNLLITQKYGSKIFIGGILTSLHLEEDSPVKNLCGECEICLKACPTGSINRKLSLPGICLSYITQKRHMEDKWFNKLGGRIFGCDTCQDVCPFNQNIPVSKIEDFRPYKFMQEPDLEEIINMDNDIFKNKYCLVAASWMGKEVIQRNALINAFNLSMVKNIKINKFNSVYLMDYYKRLLSY